MSTYFIIVHFGMRKCVGIGNGWAGTINLPLGRVQRHGHPGTAKNLSSSYVKWWKMGNCYD